jgi:hypothetical protein
VVVEVLEVLSIPKKSNVNSAIALNKNYTLKLMIYNYLVQVFEIITDSLVMRTLRLGFLTYLGAEVQILDFAEDA